MVVTLNQSTFLKGKEALKTLK